MKRYILKWAAVILSALCLTVLLTVGVSAAERNIENDDALRVGYGNLVFKDTIYLRYAVSTETYSVEDMVLLVWTEPKASVDEYLYGTQSMTLSPTGTVGISGVTHAVFDYKGLTAKQMTDYIYARVCIPSEDATEAKYGAVVKYSVLQYSYSMLGKTGSNGTTNEKLIKLLNAMLNYGAAAQEYTEYKTDWLANDAFYEVKMAGGILPDGTTTGLYKKDSKVMLTADAAADGCKFAGWQNSAGETVSTDEAYEITVGEKNEVYMAVYEEAVKYSEGLLFTSNGDGTCYVSGIGSCEDTDLVIPPTSPEGWKVTGVGVSAFNNQTQLTSVVLPENITCIKAYAFQNCNNITNITLPSSLEMVGGSAFIMANRISTVFFNGELSKWLDITFGDLWAAPLGSASQSNTSLHGCLYIQGNLIEHIKIPKGSTTIKKWAFSGFDSIISVEIPNSVTEICEGAFIRCGGLESINIPEGITQIAESTFYGCYNLYNIELPNSIRSIKDSAFRRSGLKEISIPGGVETIYSYCFEYCTNLQSVTLPDTLRDLGYASFNNCWKLEEIIIPKNLTYIPSLGFQSSGLKKVIFEGDIKTIGMYAFSGCPLEDIVFPECLTSIGRDAFQACKFSTVILPDTVSTIDKEAFAYCSNIVTIVIPKSVTSVGTSAFTGCSSLDDVYYTGTADEWDKISIGSYNDYLLTATIHYNYTPDP